MDLQNIFELLRKLLVDPLILLGLATVLYIFQNFRQWF